MAKRKTGPSSSPTTAQSLASLIKSARDIMRKDKGLSGDVDRLPLLTWVLFLKFLDDLEQQQEKEAILAWSPVQAGDRSSVSVAILVSPTRRESPGTDCSHSSTRTNARSRTASGVRACSPTSRAFRAPTATTGAT